MLAKVMSRGTSTLKLTEIQLCQSKVTWPLTGAFRVNGYECSLLRSRVLGCHATLSLGERCVTPQKTAAKETTLARRIAELFTFMNNHTGKVHLHFLSNSNCRKVGKNLLF